MLGASSYVYAEATWTQGLSDQIGAHTRAFAFVGGVTAMVVSDNLRSGITKACFYEPQVNRTYAEMAAHYGTAIIPARPYRARDKANVEVGVQIATRFIIAKLRNRQFFSLSALNAAIAELAVQINDRVSRHLGASRRALFEEIERSALKPLPAEPYVFAEWKQCRVGLDYHVEIDKHYYSVPYQLLREKVWARITARTIEVFHRGKRVAEATDAHCGWRTPSIAALCSDAFDESGNFLTGAANFLRTVAPRQILIALSEASTDAIKRGVRYRYHVSQPVFTDVPKQSSALQIQQRGP